MKHCLLHRNFVWFGVMGLCLITLLWADSQRYRTSANWYFNEGFVVVVQHAGQVTLLYSDVQIPWKDIDGLNGRFSRESSMSPLQLPHFRNTSEVQGSVHSQLIQVPYWGMIFVWVAVGLGYGIIGCGLSGNRT